MHDFPPPDNPMVTGAPTRVLVIDDSNTIRRSAEIFLRQGGHEVLLADGPQSATGRECVVPRAQKHPVVAVHLVHEGEPHRNRHTIYFKEIFERPAKHEGRMTASGRKPFRSHPSLHRLA